MKVNNDKNMEEVAVNHRVGGSNPSRGAIKSNR